MAKEIIPSGAEEIGFFSLTQAGLRRNHAIIGWSTDGLEAKPILFPIVPTGARLIAEFQNSYFDVASSQYFSEMSDLRKAVL